MYIFYYQNNLKEEEKRPHCLAQEVMDNNSIRLYVLNELNEYYFLFFSYTFGCNLFDGFTYYIGCQSKIYIQSNLSNIMHMQKGSKPLGSKILQERTSSKTFLLANNHVFNKKINQITTQSFQHIKDLGIFQHRNHPNPHTFYYEASKYDSDLKTDIDNYMIKELHHFYSNFDASYCIVYNHSSFVDFIIFRGLLEKWPEHFFQKLRRIYIVNSSLMVKIIQTCSFGAFYRLCDQLFYKVEDQAELKRMDLQVMKSIGEDPKKISSINNSKIKIIENEIYGKKIDQYDLYTAKYPVIMLRLLTKLVSHPESLKIQGIFRKSCDSDQLQKLETLIIAKNWSGIANQSDILVICGCLKKILNNLKLPLFNYGIYKRIIDFQGGDQLVLTQQVFNRMQYVNKKVFILLIVFFTQYIIKQKDFNKMNAYNLSVVFSPCFFRPEEYDLKDLMYSGKFAKVLITCFERQHEIFQQEERQLAFNILMHLQKNSLDIS